MGCVCVSAATPGINMVGVRGVLWHQHRPVPMAQPHPNGTAPLQWHIPIPISMAQPFLNGTGPSPSQWHSPIPMAQPHPSGTAPSAATHSHPFQIKLKEIFETPSEIALVLELVTGGELFDR